MKLKQFVAVFLLACVLCLIVVACYHKLYGKKTAYVELKKVFDGFQMKSDLERKYKDTEKLRARILDSLSINLKVMSKHFNEIGDKRKITDSEWEQYNYRKEELMNLSRKYQEENLNLSQQYDKQILERMTQYVIEFGKQHDYDMIYGADGNGTLMYARQENNISDEIIEFINNKYRGIE